MAILHNLGYPRVGAKRELKFALEQYWKGEISAQQLEETGTQLRHRHWQDQVDFDLVPVGDFSFYDHVLDLSDLLGNLPDRAKGSAADPLNNYFRAARGRSTSAADQQARCPEGVNAAEMTKWFDTNYHYIVPEFTSQTSFKLNAERLLGQVAEARNKKLNPKPVIIGPLTYLALGKSKDASEKLPLFDQLIPVYQQLLQRLAEAGTTWVQIDEPILVTELDKRWQQAFQQCYEQFSNSPVKLLLATYFGSLKENRDIVTKLPVAGVHLDTINGKTDLAPLLANWPVDKVLSVGVIDGRNIWKADLNELLTWLEPLHEKLNDNLWLAPSCSLLHVPVDLDSEQRLDKDVKNWLSFAKQKLAELHILKRALNHGRGSVAAELEHNRQAIDSRKHSEKVHNPKVQTAVSTIKEAQGQRQSSYPVRAAKHASQWQLPLFPTTTIGSFPQTAAIRKTRNDLKKGLISDTDYQAAMRNHIATCVAEQEQLGLDVLVHGEPERNDMVEYFGEQLAGYAFSQFGWVQSYGSRCVKPPILYGDVHRPQAMTVEWITYAQSLTDKPLKGMLTGPVTILNWSFVRDDQPLATTCRQLALAIRSEVLDLEAAGTGIIQIDEAALREGLPLRRSEWQHYLDWAVGAYRIAANGVTDATQIHTHMCYSEFNDIIASIAAMDADVITIETSRSDMELLDIFDSFNYPNAIGPGVYDIHSPNIPQVDAMVSLMKKAAERIPVERLWVNPDCGLKTRHWAEVTPALTNMVTAAQILRQEYNA